MRDVHQRVFIALDEWLGIIVAVYLHDTGSTLFWPFLILWAIAVYAISYPWYWWTFRRSEVDQRRGVIEDGDRGAVGGPAAPEPT